MKWVSNLPDGPVKTFFNIYYDWQFESVSILMKIIIFIIKGLFLGIYIFITYKSYKALMNAIQQSLNATRGTNAVSRFVRESKHHRVMTKLLKISGRQTLAGIVIGLMLQGVPGMILLTIPGIAMFVYSVVAQLRSNTSKQRIKDAKTVTKGAAAVGAGAVAVGAALVEAPVVGSVAMVAGGAAAASLLDDKLNQKSMDNDKTAIAMLKSKAKVAKAVSDYNKASGSSITVNDAKALVNDSVFTVSPEGQLPAAQYREVTNDRFNQAAAKYGITSGTTEEKEQQLLNMPVIQTILKEKGLPVDRQGVRILMDEVAGSNV